MELPTQYRTAERAVIGAALIDQGAAKKLQQLLVMGDFYFESHRAIFEAIDALIAENQSAVIDLVTVEAQLIRAGELSRVHDDGAGDSQSTGRAYLMDCINEAQSAAGAEHYIKIVKDASFQRKINQQFEHTKADQSGENMKLLGDLLIAQRSNRGEEGFDLRIGLVDMVDQILQKPDRGILTGFRRLDDVSSGIVPGELCTIGARPGAGKTAMMLKIACNMAQELAMAGNPNNDCVLYLTTEMSVKSLMQRVLSMTSGVHGKKFRLGDFKDEDIAAISAVCGDALDKWPLKIMGRPYLSIEDIKGAIYQTKAKVVFIDYLQRCKMPKAESMAYQIQGFLGDLTSFLVENKVAAFLGCQSDRELDKFPNNPPTMSHLKGSGAIESESSIVIMLWEPTPDAITRRGSEWVCPDRDQRGIEGIICKGRGIKAGERLDLQLEGSLIKMTERTGYVPPTKKMQQGDFNEPRD